MAPATTAPPMTPAANPGPQPHPRRHCAKASGAVADKLTAIVVAASKLVTVFFTGVLPGFRDIGGRSGPPPADNACARKKSCGAGGMRLKMWNLVDAALYFCL
jgi:hypothetical protein